MDIKESFQAKLNELRESAEQLDELKMDHKTYVNAMQRTTGYDAGDDEGRIDTDKLVARAKKYKGAKFAKDLEGADQMTDRPNRNKVSGQWGSDQLAWRTTPRKTKDGKANKTDLKSLRGSLTKGDYRKPRFKKVALPEETEQLDEISYKKAKEAEHKAAGKYYDAYDNEKDARKKAIRDKTPESKKEAEDAGEKRKKSAKRVIRFQKYADKKKLEEEQMSKAEKHAYNQGRSRSLMKDKGLEKPYDDDKLNAAFGKGLKHYASEKKLEEEQIDELSDPTHMSYRAKARNQMDKMVNRLGSKMGSDTVNTKKLKNRADGIKRSYKLQPKKKMNEEEQLDELKKSTLASYIKKASHDVATKSAATGRYADRANRARDEMKKGDYKNWSQGKKDDEFADKMFKKSWNRRKGIAKAADKLAK